VENAISMHPAVAEVAVIGIPDARWGEIVHAIVVARTGMVVASDVIVDHCRTLIAGYKVPRSVEVREGSLPLSGSGKVLKTALREPYWRNQPKAVN
jgi:long-chain acyl-CoA synthetase